MRWSSIGCLEAQDGVQQLDVPGLPTGPTTSVVHAYWIFHSSHFQTISFYRLTERCSIPLTCMVPYSLLVSSLFCTKTRTLLTVEYGRYSILLSVQVLGSFWIEWPEKRGKKEEVRRVAPNSARHGHLRSVLSTPKALTTD